MNRPGMSRPGLGMPRVQITVDNMRATVLEVLGDWFESQEADIKALVAEEVARFSIKEEMRDAVRKELASKMHQLVQQAIAEAMAESSSRLLGFVKRAVDSAIEAEVEDHLTGRERPQGRTRR